MLNDLAEQYFHEKNVDKRRAILKALVFKCESCSKDYFEKAFKKERKLDLKLLALRGYACFAAENEVEPFVEIIMRSLIKVPETTPYAYNLYEDMKGKYLLPYLVKTYQYPCFIQLSEQVEKQYDAMPEVFKHIYSYDEFGNVYRIREPEEVIRSMDAFIREKWGDQQLPKNTQSL